jgi:2-polyprenyl-6-methoxyphenol hydroxylase-like FAD-dependent oxidoreductase
MNELEHAVVIVGAGPTGLTLGAELKRLGIPSLILDRLEEGANTSRAAAVHARTLEVLEPLGVTPELLQEGIVVPMGRRVGQPSRYGDERRGRLHMSVAEEQFLESYVAWRRQNPIKE